MFTYFDFIFRDNTRTEDIILLSFMTSTKKIPTLIDLRTPDATKYVKDLIDNHKDHVWVGFDLQANLTCLQCFNIDISALKLIDIMVEAKMISLTKEAYATQQHDLVTVTRRYGVKASNSSSFVADMCSVVSNNADYTHQQWSKIRIYALMNIEPLPKLLNQIWDIHSADCTELTLNEMIKRGEYIKAAIILESASRGFAVDRKLLCDIFENKVGFTKHLQRSINQEFGQLYLEKTTSMMMVWSHQAFSDIVKNRGYHWETTNSERQLNVSASYFKEKAKHYPELLPLYHTRKTIDAMRTKDLRALEHKGFIKPVSVTFNQKTGRNSPRPSEGFLLNLPPWMRSLIKPVSGSVLIGIDWEQQEIAIAAALSGDRRYLDAYNAKDGDVYLTLAKMAGAAPNDATKESHGFERQTFKAVQLGLGYGKGLRSLAIDVYAANRTEAGQYLLTPSEAEEKAEFILNWHKANFFEYWDWINDTVAKARMDGYIKSLDGWTYFVDKNVRYTQLLNFPMQANGAAMMRLAVINAAKMNSFDLVCTLHDAIYANSATQNKEKTIEDVISCMDAACMELLCGVVKIRTDVSVYDEFTGYQDPRGKEMLHQVNAYIEQ